MADPHDADGFYCNTCSQPLTKTEDERFPYQCMTPGCGEGKIKTKGSTQISTDENGNVSIIAGRSPEETDDG